MVVLCHDERGTVVFYSTWSFCAFNSLQAIYTVTRISESAFTKSGRNEFSHEILPVNLKLKDLDVFG